MKSYHDSFSLKCSMYFGRASIEGKYWTKLAKIGPHGLKLKDLMEWGSIIMTKCYNVWGLSTGILNKVNIPCPLFAAVNFRSILCGELERQSNFKDYIESFSLEKKVKCSIVLRNCTMCRDVAMKTWLLYFLTNWNKNAMKTL